MIPSPVAVDSCVWGHAQNPENEYFECSSEFLEALESASSVILLLDDEGLLLKEYESQIGEPSYPQEVLALLLDSGRTMSVPVSALHADHRVFVNKLIKASKPRDRDLVKIAMLEGKLVVSDDYEDFPPATRAKLRKYKKCVVVVANSCEAT